MRAPFETIETRWSTAGATEIMRPKSCVGCAIVACVLDGLARWRRSNLSPEKIWRRERSIVAARRRAAGGSCLVQRIWSHFWRRPCAV